MIHPEDADFLALADQLAAARTTHIDHDFRIRDARGEWVWLRARAELDDGPGRRRPPPRRHRRRHHRAAPPRRAHAPRPTCAFATPSRRSPKPSCSGTPTTASCSATPSSSSLHHLPADVVVARSRLTPTLMEGGRPPVVQHQIARDERQEAGARTFEAQLGDGRWLQINERRTKDGGYVSVGTDITALKRHEEQLARIRAPAHRHRPRPQEVAPDARGPGPAARRPGGALPRAEGPGREREPRQVRVPGQHEPRAAHAAQRHHRLRGGHGERHVRPARLRALRRVLPRHPLQRRLPALAHQRHPRHVAHRGRPPHLEPGAAGARGGGREGGEPRSPSRRAARTSP